MFLFERFYNSGRNTEGNISLPDIDMDVPGNKRDEIIEYEDIWDFKMNPGEWSSVFEQIRKSPKEGSLRLGQAALRSLVDMMTDPVHVKGRTVMDHLGEFAGQRKVFGEF